MADDPDNGTIDDRPDWLPENFQSPEDLLRSYQESQRKITEQGTQIAAMNESFTELSGQIEELRANGTQPQQDTGDAAERWNDMFGNDPVGTMALLAQQFSDRTAQQLRAEFGQQAGTAQEAQAQIVASLARDQVRERFGDWDEYADRIGDEIAGNPLFGNDELWANPATAASAFEQAYTLVKGRAFVSGEIQPTQQDTRALKLAAQGITGNGARPDQVEPDQEKWDRVRGAGGGTYDSLMSPSPRT